MEIYTLSKNLLVEKNKKHNILKTAAFPKLIFRFYMILIETEFFMKYDRLL